MKSLAGLCLAGLLCLCFQNSLAEPSRVCWTGGSRGYTHTFFGSSDVRVSVPCRYRMAYVQCGGGPTLIHAENSFQESGDRVVFVSGVTVDVTTTNDDGSESHQTHAISYATFSEYKDKGDFGKSPWTSSYAGSEVDESKKLVGHYDQSTGLAVLVNGGLTITFDHVGPNTTVDPEQAIVNVTCQGLEFQSLGPYPDTLCGSPDDTDDDVEAVDELNPTDPHHYRSYFRNDYIVLAAQGVQQTNPLCQEAGGIVTSGTCKNLGEQLYQCNHIYNERYYSYPTCMRRTMWGNDLMKVYVSCLRVLCGADGASSEDTCGSLQQVYDACGDFSNIHMKISELITRAGCPVTAEMNAVTTAAPLKNSGPNIWGEYSWVCTVRDKKEGKDSIPNPSFVNIFSRAEMTMILPCRYRMANFRCEGKQIEIFTDHALDVANYVYVNGVTVKISTTNDNGTVTYQTQTNKLTLKKLNGYIKRGDLKKRLWSWSFSGGQRPKRKQRIMGKYDSKTKSGVITYRKLSIRFSAINPRRNKRTPGDLLRIKCEATDFSAMQRFPEAICDGHLDRDHYPTADLLKGIQADIHHHVPSDSVVLGKQHIEQSNPLCQELSDIVYGGKCERLGDQLYECRELTRMPGKWSTGYGKCITDNKMDVFQVNVICLRVLCGTDRASSQDTCQTLQQLVNVCGNEPPSRKHSYMKFHMTVNDLFARSNCPSSPKQR